MSAEVIALVVPEAGENWRVPDDHVLEAAKGHEFHRLVVIGQFEDGEIYLAGSANAGESLILIEHAKRQIVFGDD